MIEGYVTVSELAEKWGIHPRTIQIMCSEGKLPGATKFGTVWAIPEGTEKPKDYRETTGAYKGWRKKYGKNRTHENSSI